VNRRSNDLSSHVAGALNALGAAISPDHIEWVSPLESEKFAEYQDTAFLTRVGLQSQEGSLRAFWPRGGPVWDALAVVDGDQESGIVILEAKSHPPEIRGNGCQATSIPRQRIEAALAETKEWLGVGSEVCWTRQLYQSANRLAHLYFLRERVGVPAWLVNVYFLNDPHSPTTRAQWDDALAEVKAELGVGKTPFVAEVFLEARDRAELFGDAHH